MSQDSGLIKRIFGRDARDVSVLVADGYGLRVGVERGQLEITDGIGAHRRRRFLARTERTVRRLVVLGHAGELTLEAIRWCRDVGIAIVHLDSDGRVLLAAGNSGADDPRLRRAQALAAGTPVGLAVAKSLLEAKVTSQATVAEELLGEGMTADRIRGWGEELAGSPDLRRVVELEAQAANAYFAAWTRRVVVTFATRDLRRVPEHWRHFDGRHSVLTYGASPQKAATPVNGLLNYAYALAEAECRLAILAVGLDPGLGVVHTDRKNRDSLALDLLEPLRPLVERDILQLLGRRYFRRDDFYETRSGACRLLAPLTHELAEATRPWRQIAAGLAERTGHAFAQASDRPIPITTPLTGRNRRAVQDKRSGRRPRLQAPMPTSAPATCRTCGVGLVSNRRQLCPTCWPITRARLASERARTGAAELARQRAHGRDPTTSATAAAKRSATLSANKASERTWTLAHSAADELLADFGRDILPRLSDVPLSRLRDATGLSVSACSRIRSGKLTPHRRHWQALSVVGRVNESPWELTRLE